jgi:hypothetical protein
MTSYPIGNSRLTIVAADWNGDNKTDFIVADSDNFLTIFPSYRSGSFQVSTRSFVISPVNSIEASDFNSDNLQDLAFPNYGNSTSGLLFNTCS